MAKLIEKYKDNMFIVEAGRKVPKVEPTKEQLDAVSEMIERKKKNPNAD